MYLRGLLLESRRKSCQLMAERLPDGDEQALQQFLNQSLLSLGEGFMCRG